MARSRTPNGKTTPTVERRRREATVTALRRKKEEGTLRGDERAFVRMGKGPTQILLGIDDVTQWDDEELKRGQRRDRNGNFSGRVPDVIPKVLHDEIVRRTLSAAEALMRENLVAAVQVLVDIATGEDVEDKDRLTAIKMITERVMGAPAKTLRLTDADDKPWMQALLEGIVGHEEEAG